MGPNLVRLVCNKRMYLAFKERLYKGTVRRQPSIGLKRALTETSPDELLILNVQPIDNKKVRFCLWYFVIATQSDS